MLANISFMWVDQVKQVAYRHVYVRVGKKSLKVTFQIIGKENSQVDACMNDTSRNIL